MDWLNRLPLVEIRMGERFEQIEVNGEEFEGDDEICRWYV